MSIPHRFWWWRELEQWMRAGIAKTVQGEEQIDRAIAREMRLYKSRAERPAWVYELALRTDEEMKAHPKDYPIWPNLPARHQRRICDLFTRKNDEILYPPFRSEIFDHEEPGIAFLNLGARPGFSPPELVSFDEGASRTAIIRSVGRWVDARLGAVVGSRPKRKRSTRPISWRWLEAIDEPKLDPSMRSKAIRELTLKFLNPEILTVFHSIAKV